MNILLNRGNVQYVFHLLKRQYVWRKSHTRIHNSLITISFVNNNDLAKGISKINLPLHCGLVQDFFLYMHLTWNSVLISAIKMNYSVNFRDWNAFWMKYNLVTNTIRTALGPDLKLHRKTEIIIVLHYSCTLRKARYNSGRFYYSIRHYLVKIYSKKRKSHNYHVKEVIII